jgi:sugar/nucleoside kinase (ribokinase family)
VALGTRLWVVANAIMDMVAFVDRWPDRGGDLLAQGGGAMPGGAFNVTIAAKRLGLDTVYAGLVGTGPLGTAIQAELQRGNIAMAFEPVAGADTGFDLVMVEPDGERTFLTVQGCEAALDFRYLQQLTVAAGEVVYISGYHLVKEPTASGLAQWIERLSEDIALVLDPGPLVQQIAPKIWETVLRRVNVLTVNRREAALMTGRDEPDRAVMALREQGVPHATVLVRVGADGTWVVDPVSGKPQLVPTRSTQVIDTTGAGDVHTAAVMALWVPNQVITVVEAANVAASLAVEHAGPSWSPSWLELSPYLTAFQREVLNPYTGGSKR